MRRKRLLLLPIVLFTLAACSPAPTLQPPPRGVPPDVDLSGTWSLQKVTSREAGQPPVDSLIVPRDRRAPVRLNSKPEKGAAARLFLESGNELRISQTPDGLFISFDRSIVEEYRFGVLRTVSVGPVVAQRSSGWNGRMLEVRTLDEDGALLLETWRLAGEERLERNVRLSHRGELLLTSEQVFERKK